MSATEPKRLPISSLDEMIASDFSVQDSIAFINRDMSIIQSGAHTYSVLQRLLKPSLPYRIDDFRFVLFKKADIEVTANLRHYHVTGCALGFMGNGGIIQLDKFNGEIQVAGLLLREDFLRLAMGGRLPAVFKGGQANNYINISQQECDMLGEMITLLHTLVSQRDYSREAAAAMVAAIVHQYAKLFELHGTVAHGGLTRSKRVFDQFIDLVNEHCTVHRTLDFYAGRLCLTQRYLGTLVKQASGTTAKEWIDRAVINEAKVALKHSDITVAQLSDRLGFPNAAFFCKFFKRMTGLTPTQYQHS